MRGSPIVSEIAVAAKIRFMMISFQLACSGIAWTGPVTAQRRKLQSAVVSVEAGGLWYRLLQNVTLETGSAQHFFGVTSSLNDDVGMLDLVKIGLVQGDVQRPDILLEPFELACAEQRNNPGLLRQQPG